MDLLIPSDPSRAHHFLIAVYLQWMETMVCLAVPQTLTMEEAKKTLEGIDNVMLFDDDRKNDIYFSYID